MGLFTSKSFDNLEELFVCQLHNIYDAEQRLTKALPKMAKEAHSPDLKQAFEHHLVETEGQIRRLEEIFQLLGQDAKTETCDAMKGLISEGDEMISAKGDDAVKDAALIAAAQQVEHHEIAAYGTARTLAKQTGHDNVAALLQASLDEESAADQKLTLIATSQVNVQAKTR
ncbi:MAG: ferritin-like domain-containing protein [Pirellulaceae bacterium]